MAEQTETDYAEKKETKVRGSDADMFSAYVAGEYKAFLCDHYLKGAYLKWAPQLIGAEQWLQAKAKNQVQEFEVAVPED